MPRLPNKLLHIPAPSDEDDARWVTSSIFAITPMAEDKFDKEILPALDMPHLRMDESQLRLAASVFANSHDAIMITDGQGFILDVNRAFTLMSGYTPEEAIGRKPSLLKSGTHPEAFYDEMWNSLKTRGVWRGEIQNRSKHGDLFSELSSMSAVHDANGVLTHYVAIYTDITALKESQQKIEHLAYHDALTNLPNRALLADRIQQARAMVERHKNLLAVCFLDLDHFKPVNDTYGHQTGDRLLIEISQRLKEAVRVGDTVARLGGDEFALLLTDLESPESASHLLRQLLAKVSAPCPLGDIVVSVTASVGYTLFPFDNSDSDSLLRHADQAMYTAKLNGRKRFHLFDTAHDQRLRNYRESLACIEKALTTGELFFHYQPKVDMRRGEVVGVEALIRWQHPESGLLSPADFLFELGEHSLLCDIGDWGIGEALKQISAWQDLGLHMPVSVNIAANHLLHPEFTERLAAHLAARPEVDPHYLELEILETAALEDIAQVSRVINECRNLGVEFALDDFGTGYSSMLYLKRLPAKILKIDQSFVQGMLDDPEDLAIVEGVLGLATAFKRRAVAEGVESVEQGILLLHLNCDIAQGFGIARPMPAAALVDWVAHYQADPAWQDSLAQPWRRSDFPLLVAPVELRQWLACVATAAERGDKSLPANKISNLTDSRFGRWLFNIAQARYGTLPELSPIAELHRKTYRISAEIAVRLARNDPLRARELLTQLTERGNELIAALQALRLAIARTSRTP